MFVQQNIDNDILEKILCYIMGGRQNEKNKFKQAARLESYASYSEFIRRTALIEADNVLRKKHGSEGKE